MFFTLIIALAAVAILTMVLINYASRPAQSLEESMGIKQYGVIQNTLTSMEITFNLKQISKYALEGTLKKSFKTLQMPQNSPCQEYCNVQMINTEEQFCEPDYELNLAENMNLIIDSRTNNLERHYNLDIPANNYIISIFNKSISFIAKEPVKYTSNKLNYSFLPSFEIKSEQEIIETNILLKKVMQLNQTCHNQPLSCIQTWINENSEFSIIGDLYNIDCGSQTIENLKYHIFNYDNNLADTDFAIYIDSDISESGTSEDLETEQGFTYTFQDLNGDEHTVTITSVSETLVEGTIESEPISFSLEKDQELIFDVTGDGTYDIYISFNEFTSNSKAKLTLIIFDKPPESGYLLNEYLYGGEQTQNQYYNLGDSLCGNQGQYGNDFDSNILIEWSGETGYNPCYVAAFVQGECLWDISDFNTHGYYGMFQWGADSFTDMVGQDTNSNRDWHLCERDQQPYPKTCELEEHTDIINLDLNTQLDLLTEYFEMRGITPDDDLGKMYQSVAFPWCMYKDRNSADYNTRNLDEIVSGTSAANNPTWHYPGDNYATCKGIANYAYENAKADPSLSMCSCVCESGQTSCPTTWYEDQLGGYLESQTTTTNNYDTLLYNWPVELLTVNSCYGHRPYLSHADGFHGGNDIPTPIGTNVKPMADGVVHYICEAECAGFGNAIIIKHDDSFFTGYNHLDMVSVVVSQEVTTDTTIAKTGDTGAGGAHLDIKVYTSENEILGSNTGKNVLCFFPEEITNQLTFTGTNCHAGEKALDINDVETGYIYTDPTTTCDCSDLGSFCPLS